MQQNITSHSCIYLFLSIKTKLIYRTKQMSCIKIYLTLEMLNMWEWSEVRRRAFSSCRTASRPPCPCAWRCRGRSSMSCRSHSRRTRSAHPRPGPESLTESNEKLDFTITKTAIMTWEKNTYHWISCRESFARVFVPQCQHRVWSATRCARPERKQNSKIGFSN